MEETKLMIGDWMDWPKSPFANPHFYSQVVALERGGTSPCVGIPLTPEILEKNGWEYKKYKTDYMVKYDLCVGGKNCWMHWAIGEHNLDILRQDEKLDFYNLCVQRVVIPCDYVHELQHALHLGGLDELADNFKI